MGVRLLNYDFFIIFFGTVEWQTLKVKLCVRERGQVGWGVSWLIMLETRFRSPALLYLNLYFV